jgi:site-specific recombinase XerD
LPTSICRSARTIRETKFFKSRILPLADSALSALREYLEARCKVKAPEALDVCPRAIRFGSPTCVRLYGKGRKERLSPLWPETVSLLRSQLRRQPRADDEPIFVNRYGVPLGASGVRFKLAEYVEAATNIVPSLASKRVTPHSFRHATAVHLVAAGVDITVIRSWLGHVSLDTTNHYAQANLETKRLALERLESPAQPPKRPSWKQDQSVLAWLDTL